MSYDTFVDNLLSTLKIKVTESVLSYVNKKCYASTSSTQSKLLYIGKYTSHFTDDYKYDPNISCDPDKFGSQDVCNQYKGLFCDDITRKCVPMCDIVSIENQNVDVKVNCIGEQQSFISSSSTKDINLTQKTPVSFKDNLSDNNSVVQNSISKALNEILGKDVKPGLLQKINSLLIENVSSSYVSQTCSSNIVSVQNQYIVVQGDIYCTPDSKINITQESNVSNYINCIFSNMKPKLLASPDIADAYNATKNSDCVCDKKITSGCDKSSNKRNVLYSILKPATGNGKCDCPVDIKEEDCVFTFNKAVCVPEAWSEWSECKDGYQSRERKINIGLPECADTYQKRMCALTFDTIKLSMKEQLIKYKVTFIGIFVLLILILLIWILL